MKKILIVFFTVLLFSSTCVHAELHDRGGGLIYDDVLNVTWLQNANFAATELTDTRVDQIIATVGSIDGLGVARSINIKINFGRACV